MRMHLGPRAIALSLCLALAAPAAFADGPAAPPAAPAPSSPPASAAAVSPPVPSVDEAALQVRLDAARRRMEVAAQQLAALSAQMYGPMVKRYQVLSGSPHALIGVQLERSSATAGARVGEVSPGGPAQRAGIRSGDVIVAVNGTEVRGKDSARRAIELLRGVKPGEKVHLSVVRGAQTRDVTVIARADWSAVFLARQLPEVPLPPLPPVAALPGFRAGFGGGFRGRPLIIRGPVADMELARLTPGLGRYFGTDSGVLVVRAPPQGALGLQDGDVILSIGGRDPIDSSHVIRILASYDPGEKIALEVMRSHRKITLTTHMPADSAMSRVLLMRRDALLGPGPVVRLRAGDRVL
jgi:membrane-associated protease RseP (regulator of RpoE activity)